VSEMKIRFLGAHNCETKNTRLVSLLVDDVLAIDVGGLTAALSLEEQLRLKAVLLTHQHFDHIRDIPTLAMNLFLANAGITVHSIPEVFEVLAKNLMDEVIYPDFRKRRPENPAIRFSPVAPNKTQPILDYDILPVPVKHGVPTVGYQLSADGKTFFYTSDTGPGLTECWQQVSPQLIITEVTAVNKYSQWAAEGGHLTPALLQQELNDFKKLKGYLPPVVIVHMTPYMEKEIAAELAAVSKALDSPITLAREGMELNL
jgi:phosphoribosyl 1,2-cyclic phosphodiesterase